jgi:HD-GYP domain-containing protein (c-di-GMP phosphodiesterase class II)
MQPGVPAPSGRAGWIGVVSAAAAIAAYVVGCLIAGVSVDVRERDATILVFGALALCILALLGWRRAMRRADAATRALAEERTRQEQAERELRDVARARDRALVRERDRFRNDLSREAARADRLERLHAAQHGWVRTLGDRVARLHHAEGGEAGFDRVRETLLEASVELLEASRGVLLTRRPHDLSGALDVVANRGVEERPAAALAARFAREPVPEGTVVRESGELGDLVAIPIHLRERFHGVLVCVGRRGAFARHEDQALDALGDHVGAILQTERANAELRASYEGALRMLSEAVDARDPQLHGHSAEVARFAERIGRRLEIEPDERRLLSLASLLHDVGTIAVSERVLLKPGPLNPQEREVVELHPRIGAQVVSQVPSLRPLAPAILHHHERYDGTGYPNGLSGDDIPAPARLIAVADAFSAMMHDRPHRSRRSLDEACAVLEREAGTQFDPEMVRLLVEEVRGDPALVEDARREAAALDSIPLLGTGVGALTDNVTLLPSHRAFRDAIDSAARNSEMTGVPFIVAMVQLLELAQINRTEGYSAGDELLQACGKAMDRLAVRLGGVAGRDGGARLGLLVPRTGERDVRDVTTRVTRELGAARAVRVATAVWRAGDTGEALVRRALRRLADPSPSTPG